MSWQSFPQILEASETIMLCNSCNDIPLNSCFLCHACTHVLSQLHKPWHSMKMWQYVALPTYVITILYNYSNILLMLFYVIQHYWKFGTYQLWRLHCKMGNFQNDTKILFTNQAYTSIKEHQILQMPIIAICIIYWRKPQYLLLDPHNITQYGPKH